MTTNVSIEFTQAETEYYQASSPQAKLEALQKMLTMAPSHKGGENLRREISKKIGAVRKDVEKAKEQASKRGGAQTLNVKKEGAGQIVLIGVANSGKSTLLQALTGVDVAIAPYPFTTTKPEMGMMAFEGAKFQVVELPALMEGSAEGRSQGTQIISVARNADVIALVVNAATIAEEFAILKGEFHQSKVILNREKPRIEIRPTDFKGITISGKNHLPMGEIEFTEFLKTQHIFNAEVILGESVTYEKVLEVLDEGYVYKKSALMVNEHMGALPEALRKNLEKNWMVLTFSDLSEHEVTQIKSGLFAKLGRVIVYTKKPGEKADSNDPLVVPKGTTVEKIAELVHKDIAKNIKYARVWGHSKFEGQRVPKDYILQNFDTIEFNA
jgi:hypothetical protein